MLKLAGVDHIAGPAARLAEFVQNKTVQGVAGISQDAIISFGGLEFTKSATVREDARIGAANFIMFVTTKKWKEISPADQAAIKKISGEPFARAVGRAADSPGTAHLMEFGLMPTVLLSTVEQGHHDNLLKQENKISILE